MENYSISKNVDNKENETVESHDRLLPWHFKIKLVPFV